MGSFQHFADIYSSKFVLYFRMRGVSSKSYLLPGFIICVEICKVEWLYLYITTLGTCIENITTTDNTFDVFNMSQLMRLWYFSSSVNSIFKRTCAAVHCGYMSDPSSTSILHVCINEGSGAQARLSVPWSPM